MTDLTLTVGRDYTTSNRFEFVLFAGEKVIARNGNFKSAATARNNGIKAAQVAS